MIKAKSGFGVIEALVAVFLIGIVAYTVLQFSPFQIQGMKLSRKSSCNVVAQNLASSVNFWDNSVEIRSAYVDSGNPTVGATPNDPLCPTGNEASCDSEGLFSLNASNQLDRISPQLNIRNSYNWARNTYLRLSPQICEPGLEFTPANLDELDRLLIRNFDRVSNLVRIRVRIKDPAGACSPVPLPARPQPGDFMEVLFDVTVQSGDQTENCSSQTRVRNSFERNPAQFEGSPGEIRNGAGQVISQALPIHERCTCQRPFSVGMTCPEMFDV